MKPSITFGDITSQKSNTRYRECTVVSVDGSCAYVMPIDGNTGFYIDTTLPLSSGDSVTMQVADGRRSIINAKSNSTTVSASSSSATTIVSSSSSGTTSVDWSDILDKPTTFTPSVHSQSWATILDQPTTDAISEGTTSLYFTAARAQAAALTAFSASAPLTYSSGVFGLTQSGITHNNLSGLTTGDPHTQYLNTTRGDARYLPLTGGTVAGLLKTHNLLPETPDIYDIGSDQYRFGSLYVSNIHSTLFTEETAQLFGGYLIVPKGASSLAADSTYTTLSYPGQPWIPSTAEVAAMDFGQSMTTGDIVLMRGQGSNGNFRSEFVRVSSLIGGTVYRIEHDLMGAGVTSVWPAGTPYAVLGQDDDGWIELQSYDTPRFSVFTLGNTNATPTVTERVRIGDLADWDDSSTTRYGVGVGDFSSGNYLRYEPASGLAVKGGDGHVSIDPFGIAVSTITSSDYHKASYMFGSPSNPVAFMQHYTDEIASGYPSFLQIHQKNSTFGGIWLRSYSPNASTSTYDDEANLIVSPDGSITLGGPYYKSGIGAPYAWNNYYAQFTSASTTIRGTLNVNDGGEFHESGGTFSPGGINVGTATGAGSGEIITSGKISVNYGPPGSINVGPFTWLGGLYSSADAIIGYNVKPYLGTVSKVVVANTNTVIGYDFIEMGYGVAGIAFHTKGGSVVGDADASSERMRITSNGAVLIGRTSPTGADVPGNLEAQGDIRTLGAASATYRSALAIVETGTAADSTVGISWSNGSYGWQMARISTVRRGSTSDFSLAFYTSLAGTISEKMRISYGGALLVGATTAAGTDAVGNVEINNSLRMGGNILPINTTGAANFALDTAARTGFSLAVNGTLALTGANNFSGMFILNDAVTGGTGVFVQGGGAIALIGQSNGYFSTTKDTASKINVYLVSNVITVQNKFTSSVTINAMMFRTRATA